MTELSRTVSVDKLPPSLRIEASPAECAALALRLKIPAILALECRFTLRRDHDTIAAHGTLQARVIQSCVVSLDPLEQSVDETFALRFVPAGRERDDEDPDSPDELPYTGASIDLGEATAEQLALSLDPYPRHPDAVLDPAANDAALSTFAGLAALRRPS